MNCYDAFDDIISDFKGLLKHKRRTLGQLEEKFTLTIRDDQELIHRLEDQISQLKVDLALEQAKRVPYLCSKCRKPLVHEQYSHAVSTSLDDWDYPKKWLTPTPNLPCVSPVWDKSPSPCEFIASEFLWDSLYVIVTVCCMYFVFDMRAVCKSSLKKFLKKYLLGHNCWVTFTFCCCSMWKENEI